MPVVAAAVCPHPPVIFPEIAGNAATELDDLRAACDAAVGRLLAAAPAAIIVVGDGPRTDRFAPTAHGSLRPYGLDRDIPLTTISGEGRGEGDLPLSLQVGAWLLRRAGAGCPRFGRSVAADESPAECARLGAGLVDDSDVPIGLLVMADGSACRTEKSPGYHDQRAQPYDDRVAAALAGADTAGLLELDPALSAELKVAGRASWQLLAGAVRAGGGAWHGELSYYAAPYGVAYFVAVWEPARAGAQPVETNGGTGAGPAGVSA